MALTNSQLLDAVETAISAILAGGVASYMLSGRSVTKLDLPALMSQREKLLAAVSRDASGPFGVVAWRPMRR